MVLDPGPWIPGPESRILDPGSWILNPEFQQLNKLYTSQAKLRVVWGRVEYVAVTDFAFVLSAAPPLGPPDTKISGAPTHRPYSWKIEKHKKEPK